MLLYCSRSFIHSFSQVTSPSKEMSKDALTTFPFCCYLSRWVVIALGKGRVYTLQTFQKYLHYRWGLSLFTNLTHPRKERRVWRNWLASTWAQVKLSTSYQATKNSAPQRLPGNWTALRWPGVCVALETVVMYWNQPWAACLLPLTSPKGRARSGGCERTNFAWHIDLGKYVDTSSLFFWCFHFPNKWSPLLNYSTVTTVFREGLYCARWKRFKTLGDGQT